MESILGGFWSYANQITVGALAFHDRGILRGWQAVNELFLISPEGQILDTLDIPALRRRVKC